MIQTNAIKPNEKTHQVLEHKCKIEPLRHGDYRSSWFLPPVTPDTKLLPPACWREPVIGAGHPASPRDVAPTTFGYIRVDHNGRPYDLTPMLA